MLLGAYRAGEVADPEAYVSTAAAVIGCFPEAVAREAFDPRFGLQTRLKWLPTVSEIREACEKVADEHANRERRALLSKHRILIDTPFGPRPMEETEKATQEARDRAMAHLEKEVWPALKQSPTPRAATPPPGLTDDQRREWFERRLEALKGQPTPKLSDELRKSLNLPQTTSEAA